MTRSQIKNITFQEALPIFLASGNKLRFDTQQADVRTFARKVLIKQKLKNKS